MDEKKLHQEPEEAEQEPRPLTDQEVEEASGGRRPPPSVYHDKPFF